MDIGGGQGSSPKTELDSPEDYLVPTFHSDILQPDAWAALVADNSIDVMEIFGGAGGVTRVCVRRHLAVGPIVGLVYGFDLLGHKQRDKWMNFIETRKPKVVILAPHCTDLGGWPRLNRIRNPEGYKK